MNTQEAFNQIVSHLRLQKVKSFSSNGRCAYRGINNLKCAVGCLIPDDQYSFLMEGFTIWQALHDVSINSDLNTALMPHVNMLLFMQRIHDHYPVEVWEEEFIRVAKDLKLTLEMLVQNEKEII